MAFEQRLDEALGIQTEGWKQNLGIAGMGLAAAAGYGKGPVGKATAPMIMPPAIQQVEKKEFTIEVDGNEKKVSKNEADTLVKKGVKFIVKDAPNMPTAGGLAGATFTLEDPQINSTQDWLEFNQGQYPSTGAGISEK